MTQINANRATILNTEKTVYGYHVVLKTGDWIYTYEGMRFPVKPESVCRNTYVKDYKGDWVYQFDAVISAPTTDQKDIATILYKKGGFYLRRGGKRCDINMDIYVSDNRMEYYESLGDARNAENKKLEL